MLESPIKSRPVYKGLVFDEKARRHLVAAEGEGALAALDAFVEAGDAMAATTVVYTPGGSAGEDHAAKLAALKPDALHVMPTVETALIRLNGLLATAQMGTRLYAAGVEGFVGQVVAAGIEHGVEPYSIRTEHRGSLARRVQCVHCKGFMENVTVSPIDCAHCGVPLLVRDHYSRRLGAFQGVSIDAEAPGDVPPAEELYA
ncbi:dimethylamine monooxygenase subunit DmmA family protein [Methylopila sp. M107]|uniref:dimethylamine monooxygenase subunit DmmA family protein n=1 Tax=Methylopila sp. M107 TaxID=1101190 RepID=UPI00037FD7DF|nr:dimethylamine monooxygenase subunit DmmA family protein [Methylopila sp. M107]